VIGATLGTAVRDLAHEVERAEAKLRAGAHFLVTDVIYDVGEANRLLGALRARGVTLPVLATLAPFEDTQTLQRLSYEVPEVSIPLSALAAARRNRDNPEQTIEHAVGAVEKLLHLISGVVVHVPSGMDEPAAQLVSALAQLRRDGNQSRCVQGVWGHGPQAPG
jgi:homocysteine S-methyltransferase